MPHTLPHDPQGIVIQWRTLGGLSGLQDDTLADLTIQANGKVTIGPRLSDGQTAEGKLTTTQLQQLLSMAIDENHFFSFDSTAIENLVKAKVKERQAMTHSNEIIALPSGPPYADAGTTRILIGTDEKRVEVQYQGLFAAARDNPDIKALGQLRAIEVALLNLAETIAHSSKD